MSLLFKHFAYSFKQKFSRLKTLSSKQLLYVPIKLQVRLITTMDLASQDVEDDTDVVSNKNHTRFKKRHYNRQWEDSNQNKEDNDEAAEKKSKTFERIKRKKVVLLLGYCGVDYYGMQRNPGVRTIEEDLLKALLESKYITEDDFKNQQNMQFQRSSRTDKGVSAARQVVSLKLPLEVNLEEINKKLPDCIRVFSMKRVTNKFNSKVKCSARTYSYTLPTYALEPSIVTEEERKHYRITSEKLEQLTNALAVYKGTKSYHNFTEKKHYQDPSASRFMISFNVEKVFVDSDMEFAVLLVKGQSFMLHQIRKMVGLVIAILRGSTDMSMMEKAFGKEKVIIPTAPGLGLVLDMVHYDRYDSRYKDSHDTLTWENEEEVIQQFKHKYIYPVIVKGEIDDNSMGSWLGKLSQHNYEPSEDVPEKGIEDENGCNDDDDGNVVENNEGKKLDVEDKEPENDVKKSKGNDDNHLVSNEQKSEISDLIIESSELEKDKLGD